MTLDAIKEQNLAAGGDLFDVAEKRRLRLRVSPRIHTGPGGIFLVTSEQRRRDTERRYTVRRFDPATGQLHVVLGEEGFRVHPTGAAAHAQATDYAIWGWEGKAKSDE